MPLIIGLILGAAWMTHVVYSIGAEAWGFLIAGAVFFPIAVVHGIMIWFGAGIF